MIMQMSDTRIPPPVEPAVTLRQIYESLAGFLLSLGIALRQRITAVTRTHSLDALSKSKGYLCALDDAKMSSLQHLRKDYFLRGCKAWRSEFAREQWDQ